MSLFAIYVQLNDGNWYKCPTIGEKNRWFINWDDEEPIEFVVCANNKEDADAEAKRVVSILASLRCVMRHRELKESGQRLFNFERGYHFRPAFTADCILLKSPPRELILLGKKLEGKPRGEGVYYPLDRDIYHWIPE